MNSVLKLSLKEKTAVQSNDRFSINSYPILLRYFEGKIAGFLVI